MKITLLFYLSVFILNLSIIVLKSEVLAQAQGTDSNLNSKKQIEKILNSCDRHLDTHYMPQSFSTFVSKSLSICLCDEFPCELRARFAKKVVDDIQLRFPVDQYQARPLVVASYASGGLLQEFNMLNSLIKRGYKYIVFMPIDPLYMSTPDPSNSQFQRLLLFSEFYQNMNEKLGTNIHIFSYGKAKVLKDDINTALEQDRIPRVHVLLDIDSDSYNNDSDFHTLDLPKNILADKGVAYRLVHQSSKTKAIYWNTKGENIKLLKSNPDER